MNIERFPPADALKPFIKAFLIVESENAAENRILPDTSIVMAFRYRGAVKIKDLAADFYVSRDPNYNAHLEHLVMRSSNVEEKLESDRQRLARRATNILLQNGLMPLPEIGSCFKIAVD